MKNICAEQQAHQNFQMYSNISIEKAKCLSEICFFKHPTSSESFHVQVHLRLMEEEMRALACSSGEKGLARTVGSESARVNLKRQISKPTLKNGEHYITNTNRSGLVFLSKILQKAHFICDVQTAS